MFHLLLAVIYLSFISLGLPDSLLGSAWPSMYKDLEASVSWAGVISMIISGSTIVSSLFSGKVIGKLGTARVVVLSTAMTALAMMGFSMSRKFLHLCIWAVPYGLGAGSVDAALNNFVALHYKSRHMSWLHCMWGLGALIGPYMMSYAMASRHGWQWGYRSVGVIQLVLTAVLIFSLPLWKRRPAAADAGTQATDRKPIGLLGVLRISGATQILIMFFCYCAIEQTAMLWASSYMVGMDGMAEDVAATFTSIFLIGITVGRFANGFLTMRFSDPAMIRIGTMTIGLGALLLLVPVHNPALSAVAFILVGLGCAPVYPCIIHSTPTYFGADKSQAIVGVQMAFAYVGTMLMPPLFGVIAQATTIAVLPWCLLVFVAFMAAMHEWLRALRRDDMAV